MQKFKPQFYKNITFHTKSISKQAIDKYEKLLNWKNDGTDTLLDVGCGVGDLTRDLLLPIMPNNFDKVVGYDISKDMVKYATETYGSKKLKFEYCDITADLDSSKIAQFDHVVSMYALQWVNNRRNAVSNISKLLKQNGNFIYVFPTAARIFDFIDLKMKSKKWSSYMSHYKPVWMSSSNLFLKEFQSYLKESGFKIKDIEINHNPGNFHTYHIFKDMFYGINPVHDCLTKEQQEELFDEFVEYNLNYNSKNPINGEADTSFCMQMNILSGYAVKIE